MHRHADLEATADTYGRVGARHRPDDRCFSVAKLFFAYGLGNSLTFPFAVGATAVLDPGPADAARGRRQLVTPSSRRCSSPAPASAPPCSTPTCPPTPSSSVRLTVTAGEALPAELHRRFTERFGVPVLDGIGSTEALHIFLSNHAGAERPGTSGTPVDGYEVKLLDDDGAEVARRRHARLPARQGRRRSPPATGSRDRRHAADVPGRVAADRSTSTPAPPTATGRSSAATTT